MRDAMMRQARAIALPATMAGVVPALILAGGDLDLVWGLDGPAAVLVGTVAVALIAAGFALWLWTVRLFATRGQGTLAPWDPPQHLVVAGPYRWVRNPMISAVIAVLAGEALLFGSPALAVWCGAFFVVNVAWFLVYEEPNLEERFGDEYAAYKREVPRWIPRKPR